MAATKLFKDDRTRHGLSLLFLFGTPLTVQVRVTTESITQDLPQLLLEHHPTAHLCSQTHLMVTMSGTIVRQQPRPTMQQVTRFAAIVTTILRESLL